MKDKLSLPMLRAEINQAKNPQEGNKSQIWRFLSGTGPLPGSGNRLRWAWRMYAVLAASACTQFAGWGLSFMIGRDFSPFWLLGLAAPGWGIHLSTIFWMDKTKRGDYTDGLFSLMLRGTYFLVIIGAVWFTSGLTKEIVSSHTTALLILLLFFLACSLPLGISIWMTGTHRKLVQQYNLSTYWRLNWWICLHAYAFAFIMYTSK